jgi:RHS repeat-associated protein
MPTRVAAPGLLTVIRMSYAYDSLKRLIETRNPDATVVRYAYDANGNLTGLIDSGGNITAFEYDTMDRLTKKIYADGKATAYTYDTAGLPINRVNARGITTSYTFDENHDLSGISYSDGTPAVTYQYDDYDRLKSRQDGTGLYQFGYDADSQLMTVDGPWADDTVTYNYDALGRRTSLTPQNGQAVSYAYDNLNRLTGIQAGTNAYSYSYTSANPLVQSLMRPNTGVTDYQYDSLNRLTEVSNKNSSAAIINRFVYGYDLNKDVRASETITNGNPITSFQNELVTYDYNKVNQLLSSTTPFKTFTYDDDGNMTRGYTPDGYVFTAAYDAEDRLKSIEYTDSGGVVQRTEYLYSGDNFLAKIKKYENSVLVSDIRFVRDGFLSVQERDGSNNVAREYMWGLNLGGGIGGLLNLKQGGQNYSYLYDGKGSVTALTDGNQSVIATYTYDTFGNLMTKTGTLNQPFQFSTKPYDEKTGLSYYGYRFYSPSLGRWITRDPLGEAGGMNLYEFNNNSAINYIDPDGLFKFGSQEGKFMLRLFEEVGGEPFRFQWRFGGQLHHIAESTRYGFFNGLHYANESVHYYWNRLVVNQNDKWLPIMYPLGGKIGGAFCQVGLVAGSAYVGWEVGSWISKLPVPNLIGDKNWDITFGNAFVPSSWNKE